MTVEEEVPVSVRVAPRKKPSKSAWRRRKPIKKATIWLHRWTSLVLGLLLVVITTTGAVVLYTPEWTTWTNHDAYAVQTSDRADWITFQSAIDTVNRAHPDFGAGGVVIDRGVYKVQSLDYEGHPGYYGVDPANGRITGFIDTSHGFMAFMNQVHECFFTCEGNTGYLSWTTASVPLLNDVTWASLALGSMGLLLIFLGVSGIWLWYPTIRKWRHGFRLRMDKGRYARDYDLHQLVGMAAVPFLLMWGITGANFEFEWVGTAWYAVTGGHDQPESSFTSAESKQPDIGLDAAFAAAQTVAGPDSVPVSANLPAEDDATGTYFFYFGKGFDAWRHGSYPGDYGVSVDRHDAARTHVDDYSNADTVSNQLLDNYGAPMFHYGVSVNGWWRVIWFVFGLTPLLLAVTGVSTWLAKRSVRKRRKEALKARAA